MDSRSLEIYSMDDEEMESAFNKSQEHMKSMFENGEAVPLSADSVQTLSSMSYEDKLHLFRKNSFRNKPCICGSGRKFKKCCKSKLAL